LIALFDSTYEQDSAVSAVHQLAAMPLNHLGLVLKYHDIKDGLPPLHEMDGVRGVITWFRTDPMDDPATFLNWAGSVIDSGRKFVVIGSLNVDRDRKGRTTPLASINRFWGKLGLRQKNEWAAITYDWKIQHKNPEIVDFERELREVLPPFNIMARIDARARSHFVVRFGDDSGTDSHLVVTHPNGGYVAEGFMHYSTTESRGRQWYVNPFAFFSEAFATSDLPKPDTTTISGRRIFYSHVDGDGWRNLTEIPPYRQQRSLASEVIQKEVLEAFRDLPVTVAPIAGDLDPNWHGTERTLEIARSIFNLPHVEAGSHTYAHPLDWKALGETRASHIERHSQSWTRSLLKYFQQFFGQRSAVAAEYGGFDARYEQPISYTVEPFDLDREIRGSVDFINGILPSGKRVRLIQWSGNTRPFEAAIEAANAAGVKNLNGGDSRFDNEYYSYGWVSPIGRHVGKQRQIYSSNSNENTYTDLWTDRFFGFRYLLSTLENTETPIRVKPHNIYFHMYSGEKLAGLTAVIENFRYAALQEIAPVTASHFAAIADGFFTTQISVIGDRQWRVSNRGELQTIRFDHAALERVDFARSSGVLGQRHYQGSLYVALDPAVSSPVIALEDYSSLGSDPSASVPYLIQSRWMISNLRISEDGFEFDARGFGSGEFIWRVPARGHHIIRVMDSAGSRWEQLRRTDDEGRLQLDLGKTGFETAHVSVFLFDKKMIR
jgi:hypothetical protein